MAVNAHVAIICALWEQSGCDPNLEGFHNSNEKRHVGNDADEFSKYASVGTQILLRPDSCICRPCHTDFQRNYKLGDIPRWLRIKQEFYHASTAPTKHCIVCCDMLTSKSRTCMYMEVSQWGPSCWYGTDPRDLHLWKQYLTKVVR